MLFGAFQPPSPHLIFAQPSLGKKQLKGWRRAKRLSLIRTINPEFKDLAQTWGWKMITEHQKMYP
jgi:hypothetical protein